MKIRDVDAVWLHCPLPEVKQHTSDFGRMTAFDGVIVTIRTDDGLIGYGESKAGVGSVGNGAALLAIIENELKPLLVGEDARDISRLWNRMMNGSRADLAARFGHEIEDLGPTVDGRPVPDHQEPIAGHSPQVQEEVDDVQPVD